MDVRPRRDVTRRAFVKLGGLTLAGGALVSFGSACAPIQAPAAPTAAPAKPATPVGGATRPTQAPQTNLPVAGQAAAATAPPTPSAAKPTGAPAAQKPGGTLRYAHLGGFLNFDGHRFASTNHPFFNLLYNSLVTLDSNMNPQPELAESWQFSEDGRALTLKLRKGVKFHNGRELTSEDVKLNIERIKDPKTAAHAGPLAASVDQIETPDAQTALFRLNRVTPNIFDLLDLTYIIAPEGFGEVAQHGIGTGPFKLQEWKPQESSVFTRHADYFKSGRPLLDQVIVQVIGDAASMVLFLESGTVDIVERPPAPDAARLRTAGIKIDEVWGGNVSDTLINTRQEPFDDKRVRQALSHATNRERAVAIALGGFGEAWCLPFPKASIAYSAEAAAKCKFDLAEAKRLLDQAGVASLEFELLASTATFPDSAQRAQLLQADLAHIGVRAQIRDTEAPDYRERTWGDKYQVAIHAFGRANRDPDTLFRVARAWWPKNNFAGFESEEYTRLVNEAGSTLDVEKRKVLYRQLADLIVDEAFMITVSPTIFLYGARPQVQGLSYSVEGHPVYENITIA